MMGRWRNSHQRQRHSPSAGVRRASRLCRQRRWRTSATSQDGSDLIERSDDLRLFASHAALQGVERDVLELPSNGFLRQRGQRPSRAKDLEGQIVELSVRGGRAAGCGLGRRCPGSCRCHQFVDRAA